MMEHMTNTINDGRHDFDFFFGSWTIRNRKLANMADPECDEWVEFDATGYAHPILGGLGNVDTFSVPEMPNGKSFEGATLRLFDTETGLWKIWWASTSAPGRLDPPVVGQFTDKHGVFLGEDVVGGKPVEVRFDWNAVDEQTARWEQAFSFDTGRNWVHNWRMDFTRVEG
jgi:hypothetical protein